MPSNKFALYHLFFLQYVPRALRVQALQNMNHLEGYKLYKYYYYTTKKSDRLDKQYPQVCDAVRLQQLTIAEKLCTNIWKDLVRLKQRIMGWKRHYLESGRAKVE